MRRVPVVTLPDLRREARRVFGRDARVSVEKEPGFEDMEHWFRVTAHAAVLVDDIDLAAPKKRDAMYRMLRCLRSIPSAPRKRGRGGK